MCLGSLSIVRATKVDLAPSANSRELKGSSSEPYGVVLVTFPFSEVGEALAVENALKVAMDWKVQKNFKKGYTREIGTKVIQYFDWFLTSLPVIVVVVCRV